VDLCVKKKNKKTSRIIIQKADFYFVEMLKEEDEK